MRLSDEPGTVTVSCKVQLPLPQPPPMLDVIYGRGYWRRGTDADGNLIIETI